MLVHVVGKVDNYAIPVKERLRVKQVLEKMIHEMLTEMDGNAYQGILLPH